MSEEIEHKEDGLHNALKEIRELAVTVAFFLPIWFFVNFFAYELRSIPSESMVPTLQVGDRVAVSKFSYGYSKRSVPFGLGNYLPLGEGRVFAHQPKRGDVVVFKHPYSDKTMIKRLIGLPGDTIKVQDNRIILNGEIVPQEDVRTVVYQAYGKEGRTVRAHERLETLPNGKSYLVHDITSESNGVTPTFIVPEGYYFFMGDNRDNSADSRVLLGHCPPINGVIDRAGCEPPPYIEEPTIGFVPYDNLIGRADTVLFTLNFCSRYESGCPKGRVWKNL